MLLRRLPLFLFAGLRRLLCVCARGVRAVRIPILSHIDVLSLMSRAESSQSCELIWNNALPRPAHPRASQSVSPRAPISPRARVRRPVARARAGTGARATAWTAWRSGDEWRPGRTSEPRAAICVLNRVRCQDLSACSDVKVVLVHVTCQSYHYACGCRGGIVWSQGGVSRVPSRSAYKRYSFISWQRADFLARLGEAQSNAFRHSTIQH